MSDRFHWAPLLAFVTGLVNQELLLRNECLAAENRILRAHLPSRLRLIAGEQVTPGAPWQIVICTAVFIVERIGLNPREESTFRRPTVGSGPWHYGAGGQNRSAGLGDLLNQIYEVDFSGFSYGFRPGRSPHQALDASGSREPGRPDARACNVVLHGCRRQS